MEEGLRLFVWSIPSDHHGAMDVAPLIERLGHDFPIHGVARKLVCTRRGAREFTVNPYWNNICIPGAPKVFQFAPA
jgi:hypothetical protein